MCIFSLDIGLEIVYNIIGKECGQMISYARLLNLLTTRNVSIYKLKSDKVVGSATVDKLRKNEGNIDTRSIDALCKYLDCQPGDLMEYIPDE